MSVAEDQAKCKDNPWVPDSQNYVDYINSYKCWLYDPSIPNPEPLFQAPTDSEPVSMSYSSAAYESAPAATSAPTASKTVVKGLQIAINKFFGVTLGAPISVDGVIGGETLSAVKSILEWMPQAGYDTSTITRLIGTSPTAASISLQAAALSNVIDWVADDNGFTLGTTPSAPSVPAIQTSAGKAPAGPLPKGPSQRKAGGILGLGLPDPVVYGGGAALVIGLAWLVIKHKRKTVGVEGPKRSMNAYGLTFYRWWRAAGYSSERKVPTEAYDAWANGEDPSDWRAAQQRQY